MTKPSLRNQILDAGLKVMFRQGYIGSGVRDIVAEAQAPQGSFTNHFRSKEIFAREVLDRYFEHTKGLVAQALDDKSLSARERLRRYLDIITARLAADGFTRGCLMACIAEAQAAGEIAATFTADDLAEFLLASWEGAILRMKVERSAAPLERFKTIAFDTVFKEP